MTKEAKKKDQQPQETPPSTPPGDQTGEPTWRDPASIERERLRQEEEEDEFGPQEEPGAEGGRQQ